MAMNKRKMRVLKMKRALRMESRVKKSLPLLNESKYLGYQLSNFHDSDVKQMLKEKNLLPFGTWERELPKFAFDPRFKSKLSNDFELNFSVLPDVSDRKAVFEDFVKNKMEEERKDRRDRFMNAK